MYGGRGAIISNERKSGAKETMITIKKGCKEDRKQGSDYSGVRE